MNAMIREHLRREGYQSGSFQATGHQSQADGHGPSGEEEWMEGWKEGWRTGVKESEGGSRKKAYNTTAGAAKPAPACVQTLLIH